MIQYIYNILEYNIQYTLHWHIFSPTSWSWPSSPTLLLCPTTRITMNLHRPGSEGTISLSPFLHQKGGMVKVISGNCTWDHLVKSIKSTQVCHGRKSDWIFFFLILTRFLAAKMSPHGRLIATMTAALVTPTSYAQRTKPITSAKGRGWNGHRFLNVSLIVAEDLTCVIQSGKHVYQKSSFFVSPLSFLRVSW